MPGRKPHRHNYTDSAPVDEAAESPAPVHQRTAEHMDSHTDSSFDSGYRMDFHTRTADDVDP